MSVRTCTIKRLYATKDEAVAGAAEIKVHVEGFGRTYIALHPYKCPDYGTHWHLTHYQQGYAICPLCRRRAPAWRGRVWIIGWHQINGARCDGVGQDAL